MREHARLLAEATSTVADPQIRHRGTLGGALAHADPAGDLGAPVLALEATLVAAGPSGRRSIPVAEFFDDYFTTTLQPEEILVEVRIPKLTGWAARYEKFNRVAHAWSIVAVAATVQTDGGTIRQARVALTNMAAVPVRAHAVERALVGQPATTETVRAAAEQATEGTSPMSDGNADADYRRQLARVLTRRAVATAADVA
ncbi:carbon monoxide dehydrogenase medium subunit [Rhodococcus aetherivorans]|nr:carbon monoxide dehydrogenase medium subunit [Rhodococcus aetherivorans]